MSDLRPIVVDSSVAIALVRDEPVASSIRQTIRFWAEINQIPRRAVSLLVRTDQPALPANFDTQVSSVLQAVDEVEELTLITVNPDRPPFLLSRSTTSSGTD